MKKTINYVLLVVGVIEVIAGMLTWEFWYPLSIVNFPILLISGTYTLVYSLIFIVNFLTDKTYGKQIGPKILTFLLFVVQISVVCYFIYQYYYTVRISNETQKQYENDMRELDRQINLREQGGL